MFGENHSLMLLKVTPEDSGSYECAVNAKIGGRNLNVVVELVVNGEFLTCVSSHFKSRSFTNIWIKTKMSAGESCWFFSVGPTLMFTTQIWRELMTKTATDCYKIICTNGNILQETSVHISAAVAILLKFNRNHWTLGFVCFDFSLSDSGQHGGDELDWGAGTGGSGGAAAALEPGRLRSARPHQNHFLPGHRSGEHTCFSRPPSVLTDRQKVASITRVKISWERAETGPRGPDVSSGGGCEFGTSRGRQSLTDSEVMEAPRMCRLSRMLYKLHHGLIFCFFFQVVRAVGSSRRWRDHR